MDIKDAKEQLTELRIELRKKLCEFEKKTGLKVQDIRLHKEEHLRGPSVLVDVEIEVKL